MKSTRPILLLILLLSGCGGGGGGGSAVIPVVSKSTATIASILVTPVNYSVSAGTSQQFAAVGVYTDNSKHSLTTPISWTSSNGSVAAIDPSTGNVLSVTTGTTLITAVSGSFANSTVLKVTSGGAAIGSNVLPVTVNGSFCTPATSSNYPNKPCVSVTICTPGTSACQTIDDILLDTGSYGLRLFHQVVTVPLSTVTTGSGGSLAECVQFGDGSTEWGPIERADVMLAGEPAVTVPVQIINQSFAKPPTACAGVLAETSPTQHAGAGYNGILGVGLFAYDCGGKCVSSAIGMYYSCIGTACTGTTAALPEQVQNPVSALPVDNNGVILSLPSISSAGASSAKGALILGIDTQSNNAAWAVTTYAADANSGTFTTLFGGNAYSNSFIDSGSNGFFFPSGMATCSGWYCPLSPRWLLATNRSSTGSPSASVSFPIANATVLFNSGNSAFNDLGASSPGGFDWGLPFFFGRDVYVGLDGMSSSPGTGPFWAY